VKSRRGGGVTIVKTRRFQTHHPGGVAVVAVRCYCGGGAGVHAAPSPRFGGAILAVHAVRGGDSGLLLGRRPSSAARAHGAASGGVIAFVIFGGGIFVARFGSVAIRCRASLLVVLMLQRLLLLIVILGGGRERFRLSHGYRGRRRRNHFVVLMVGRGGDDGCSMMMMTAAAANATRGRFLFCWMVVIGVGSCCSFRRARQASSQQQRRGVRIASSADIAAARGASGTSLEGIPQGKSPILLGVGHGTVFLFVVGVYDRLLNFYPQTSLFGSCEILMSSSDLRSQDQDLKDQVEKKQRNCDRPPPSLQLRGFGPSSKIFR